MWLYIPYFTVQPNYLYWQGAVLYRPNIFRCFMCACVCAYACVCVCMHVCVRAYMCVLTCICAHVTLCLLYTVSSLDSHVPGTEINGAGFQEDNAT